MTMNVIIQECIIENCFIRYRYNHVFITLLTTTTLLIVTNYCALCLLVLTLYVNDKIIEILLFWHKE